MKRKLGAFKKEFIKFRGSDASKVKFNEWCDASSLKDYKVDIEEVDTSKKIEPNVSFFQVFCNHNVAF